MATHASLARALVVLCAAAVCAGAFARVWQLDRKMFWQDEAFTALRVSGHHEPAFRALFDGRTHPASQIAAFQVRDPRANVRSVLQALAAEDPDHGPLFYASDRLAIDVAGSSPAAYRSPSVLFGLIALGLAFALGAELFGSGLAGALTAALVAVSPMQVLYARQAREYALLFAAVLLGTFALVRALRHGGWPRWLAYGATVAIGGYSDPIFGLALAAHGVTVLWRARGAVLPFALAGAGGIAAFGPWAAMQVASHAAIRDELSWGTTPFPPLFVAQKWAFNVGALFFDAEFAHRALTPVAALIVLLVVAAVAVVVVRPRTGLAPALVLPLIAVPIIAFGANDAIHGSHYSTIPRYLMVSWAGVYLAIVAAWSWVWNARPRTALVLAALLLAAGSASSLYGDTFANWWDNNDNVAYQMVGRRINTTPAPLVISAAQWHVPLVLGRYVRLDATFLLFRDRLPPIPPSRLAYVVEPSAHTLEQLTSRRDPRYEIKNVSPPWSNAITGFHAEMRAATGAAASNPLSPGNALWEIRAAEPYGRASWSFGPT